MDHPKIIQKKLPGVRSRTFGQDEQSELDSHISFVDGKYLGIDIGDRENWSLHGKIPWKIQWVYCG